MSLTKTLGEEILESLENGRIVSDEEMRLNASKLTEADLSNLLTAEELIAALSLRIDEVLKGEDRGQGRVLSNLKVIELWHF